MTGDLALSLFISLAGVLVLVGVSYLLGGFRSASVTREAAADRLAFDEPDFDVREWLIGADGKSAAAISGRETALVFALGDGLASRRFPHERVAVERQGATVLFRLNEPSLPRLKLVATDDETAAQWLSRLNGRAL